MLAIGAINFPSLLLNPCILLGQAKIFHIIRDTVQPSISQMGLVPPTSVIALSASSLHLTSHCPNRLNCPFLIIKPTRFNANSSPSSTFFFLYLSAVPHIRLIVRTLVSVTSKTLLRAQLVFQLPTVSQSISRVLVAPQLLLAPRRLCFTRHLSV